MREIFTTKVLLLERANPIHITHLRTLGPAKTYGEAMHAGERYIEHSQSQEGYGYAMQVDKFYVPESTYAILFSGDDER